MRKFFVQGTMYSLFSYNRLFQNKIHTPYTDLDLQLYQYMNIHLQEYIAQCAFTIAMAKIQKGIILVTKQLLLTSPHFPPIYIGMPN